MKRMIMSVAFLGVCLMSAVSFAEDLPKIGVDACDNYITKYSQCLEKSVPEAARDTMRTALKTTVEGWKTALNSTNKEVMTQSCTAALTATKQAMAAYNCTWE